MLGGVADGVAHLRIENRALPSGPTVIDEIANSAFFAGLMLSLPEEYGDIAKRMTFDDAKTSVDKLRDAMANAGYPSVLKDSK